MGSAAELSASPDAYPSARMTASRLGIDPELGAAAIRRLADAGFIETSGGWEPDVVGPRERGFREVGWWPDEQAVVERLLEAIEVALRTAPPDQRNWYEKMRGHLLEAPQDAVLAIGSVFLAAGIAG